MTKYLHSLKREQIGTGRSRRGLLTLISLMLMLTFFEEFFFCKNIKFIDCFAF